MASPPPLMAPLAASRAVATLCLACLMATTLVSADTNETAAADKVKLAVYYESLCPDSRRFFLDQLVPTFGQLGQIIEPLLVPFGHARVLGDNKLVCQHGSRECEGNRLMACIQNRAGAQHQAAIPALGCVFAGEPPKECVEKFLPNATYDDIDKCKGSEESYLMMIKNEQLTGKVSYVPRITVNGEWSHDIQSNFEFELKSNICNTYKGTPIEACKA